MQPIDNLGEAWREDLTAWLAANLPAELTAAGYVVREAQEEGERPDKVIVVGLDRVERVPGMEATGRVHGGIVLRAPHDDFTLAQHRAHAAALWGLLDTLVAAEGGPMDAVYLHDVRWEDRVLETREADRLTGWPISTMATLPAQGYELLDLVNLGSGAYTIYGDPFGVVYDGKLYAAPIKSNGSREVTARELDLETEVVTSEVVRVSGEDDDHNNGFLVVDPETRKVMVTVTDHANGSLAGWLLFRGTSLAVGDLPGAATVQVGTAAYTYSGGYLCPGDLDQLDVFVRDGAGIEGQWQIDRTEDVHASPPVFVEYALGLQQYLKQRVAIDGSGVWLVYLGHPGPHTGDHDGTQQPQRMSLWKLRWSDDAILTGTGTVEEADFKAMGGAKRWSNVNRVEDSDDFGAAVWDKDNASIAKLGTLPNRWGETVANGYSKLLDQGTGDTYHRMSQEVTVTAGEIIEISCFLRINLGEKDSALLYGVKGSRAAGDPYVGVRMVNGVATIDVTNGLIYSEVQEWSDGWIRIGGIYVADTTVTDGIFVFQRKDTGTNGPLHTLYPGEGTGMHVQGVQVAVTPYTDRLMPYMQNNGAPNGPTNAPAVVHDCEGTEHGMVLDFVETATHLHFLLAIFDRWDGVNFGSLEARGRIVFKRFNKTTGEIDEEEEVAEAGEGYDDDPTTGSHTYLGGSFVGTGGREFVVDESNLNLNGKTRLVHYRSKAAGVAWVRSVLLETIKTGDADDVMRPQVLDEVTYASGALRHTRSRRLIYMRGQYAGYKPSRGDFGTEVWAARL
jgi:hypothetical protein